MAAGQFHGSRESQWCPDQRRQEGVFVFLATTEYLPRIEVLLLSSGNPTELAKKEASLIAAIEKMLSDFARACRAQATPVVIMHQDAFAADYQEEEYRLMGMAIKFAGICGKEVHIIGTNRHTVDQSTTTH
jgi:hypothetical protein